jgi:hypothetical protein
MPHAVEDGVLHLSGDCGPEEAAAVAAMLAQGIGRVRLEGITSLSAPVMDALMAARPEVETDPPAAPGAPSSDADPDSAMPGGHGTCAPPAGSDAPETAEPPAWGAAEPSQWGDPAG